MHPRVSVNAVSTPNYTFEEDLALWDSLGVQWVSLDWGKLVIDPDCASALARVRAAPFAVSAIVHSGMYTLDRPDTWDEANAAVKHVLDGAAEVSARCVYGTPGPPGRLAWEEAAGALSSAVGPAIEHARAVGVPLAIEPTSRMTPSNFVHSLDDAIELADQTGLRICFDTFWCGAERALRSRLRRAMPAISHFQIADIPLEAVGFRERAFPGEGRLPLERVIGWALDLGYLGPLEVEVLGPVAESRGYREVTARGAEWLSKTLACLGP